MSYALTEYNISTLFAIEAYFALEENLPPPTIGICVGKNDIYQLK